MEKVLIVYQSSTSNTELMAETISKALSDTYEVTCLNVQQQPSIEGYDKYILGCPSCDDEALDTIDFEPWFKSIESELVNKKVALFGSYGWGDGQWMRDWAEYCQENKFDLFNETLILNYTPDDEGLEQCVKFANDFMAY